MCIATANADELAVPPAAAPEFPATPAPPEKDGYKWKRVADATSAGIEVHKVSPDQLRKMQGDSDLRVARSPERKGYTVLRRNKETGAFHADIYMTDPSDQETLKHELLHARGWAHNE